MPLFSGKDATVKFDGMTIPVVSWSVKDIADASAPILRAMVPDSAEVNIEMDIHAEAAQELLKTLDNLAAQAGPLTYPMRSVFGTVYAETTLSAPHAPEQVKVGENFTMITYPKMEVMPVPATCGCTRCGQSRRYPTGKRAIRAFSHRWKRHVCPRGSR